MSTRATSGLAWSLAALSVAMFLASVVLFVLAHSAQEAHGTGSVPTLRSVVLNVPFLTFPLVGALIASRRPHNPIGWICLVVGFLWGFTALSDGYIAYGISKPGSVPFVVLVAALTYWVWVLPVGLLGIYLLLLFPDGRLPSSRWRPLGWLSGGLIVLMSAAGLLTPGPLTQFEGVRNPFGLEGAPWLVDASIVLLMLLGGCIFASALSLVLRYRHSGGEVREQIKWIALAASFVGLTSLGSILSVFIFAPEFMRGSEGTPPSWFGFLQYVTVLSFAGVPVAIGFAVLKYRLYAIDLIINRTLIYGSLTATLVALYFGGVTATQALFRALTGQEQQPQFAVVVSTLLIAALFTPLRRRIQSLIDRRFYRRKYDARKTLEAFSVRLREETDLQTLNNDFVGVVRDTMQPAHVSLWLRPDTASKGDQAD